MTQNNLMSNKKGREVKTKDSNFAPFTRELGTEIKKLRKENDVTQDELADNAGIERSYMGGIERGERNPTLYKIFKIAKALHVKVKDLFSS